MRIFRSYGFDMGLLYAVLVLIGIGFLVIYSASHMSGGVSKVIRQVIWVLIGLVGTGVLAHVDYRPWARYWRMLVLLSTVILVAVLFTRPINGARSWIELGPMRFQPSEFATLAIIIALAGLLSRYGARVQLPRYFCHTMLLIALPCLLIFVQPDLGMLSIICAIWLIMVFVAGARWWMILSVCLTVVLLFMAAWTIPMPNGKTLIKDYQKKRLNFIHADPSGTGYHQRQAQIAIGAGEIWGRGFLHGTQGRRRFLPEQDTDFVFAVIGEEFGLIGCLVVLGLYLFVLTRMMRIAEEAESYFGQLIVVGAATMIAVHVLVNIGMCLSLSPVTGITLPFISYGGSNALVNLMMVGIVLNISRHRQSQRKWAVSEELVRV